jgi:hypothetical protein
MPAASKRICRPTKQLLEFSNGPTGDNVRLHCLGAYLLKSLGKNLDIGKFEASNYFG